MVSRLSLGALFIASVRNATDENYPLDAGGTGGTFGI